jgi:hypothetical protein
VAGLLDRRQRLAGALGVLVEQHPRSAGLDRHDAEAVRDDVVELAGDAGSLGERHRLLLPLEPVCAELELLRAPVALRQRPADRPGPGPQAEEEDDAPGIDLARVDQDDGGHGRVAGGAADEPRPLVRMATGDPERRDQRKRIDHARGDDVAAQQRLESQHREHRHRRAQREPMAEQERQRPQQRADGRDGPGGLCLAGPDLDLGHDGKDDEAAVQPAARRKPGHGETVMTPGGPCIGPDTEPPHPQV